VATVNSSDRVEESEDEGWESVLQWLVSNRVALVGFALALAGAMGFSYLLFYLASFDVGLSQVHLDLYVLANASIVDAKLGPVLLWMLGSLIVARSVNRAGFSVLDDRKEATRLAVIIIAWLVILAVAIGVTRATAGWYHNEAIAQFLIGSAFFAVCLFAFHQPKSRGRATLLLSVIIAYSVTLSALHGDSEANRHKYYSGAYPPIVLSLEYPLPGLQGVEKGTGWIYPDMQLIYQDPETLIVSTMPGDFLHTEHGQDYFQSWIVPSDQILGIWQPEMIHVGSGCWIPGNMKPDPETWEGPGPCGITMYPPPSPYFEDSD
jgi:hypothetical protein